MFFKRKYQTEIADMPGEYHLVVQRGMRIFVGLVLAIALLLTAGGTVIYLVEQNGFIDELKAMETTSMGLQSTAINRELDHIVADILFMARQNELVRYLDSGDPEALRDLGREYLQLAAGREEYDQLRFLDIRGMERLRVNHRDGKSEIAPRERLQDKGDRYYFTQCLALGAGSIYLSPLDLNVENGRVEQPLRPTLRIGTPVFDSTGAKRGIVLINDNAQNLLNRILAAGTTSEGLTMLLNCRGHWLICPDAAKEWGFMYPDKVNVTFAREYPDEWKRVVAEEHGQFLTDNGLFTFSLEDPMAVMRQFSEMIHASPTPTPGADEPSPYFWTLVSLVPPETLDDHARTLLFKLFAGGGLLLLVMSFGAYHLALAVSRRQLYQEQLVAAALYDPLTDLPNRKLFFERLDSGLTSAKRYERKLALLYIDLDGFKAVNDTRGHTAGDELLKRVGVLLSATVRSSDTVARLGGDEFAIILSEVVSVEGAALVGEKIVSEMRSPITLRSGPVTVGASVGVAVYPDHGTSPDDLVKGADQAMYCSKDKGKNTCTLANSSRCQVG